MRSLMKVVMDVVVDAENSASRWSRDCFSRAPRAAEGATRRQRRHTPLHSSSFVQATFLSMAAQAQAQQAYEAQPIQKVCEREVPV